MLLQMYAAFGKASNVSHNLIVKKLITGIGIDCNVAFLFLSILAPYSYIVICCKQVDIV